MSVHRKPEPQEPSASAKLLSFIYFVIIAGAAYYLSRLAMPYLRDAGLTDITIPKLNKPLPPWVVQLVIGIIILFMLQFILVFLFGLVKGRKKNVYEYTPPSQRGSWRR